MSDDASRWKEKYLQVLEQQEQNETRWNARLDLLRRSLVRSSFAAEGSDPAVEKCMRELRTVLRDDDLDRGLASLVPRLEKAVLDSERFRQERLERLAEGFRRLATQLLELPLPSEVRKPLRAYARKVSARVSQTRELPVLLGELAELQDRALTLQLAGIPRPVGLFGRLFGSPKEASVRAETAAPQHMESDPPELEPERSVADTQAVPVDQSAALPDSLGEVEAPDAPEALVPADVVELPLAQSDDETLGDETVHVLPPTPEQAYSAIAERVESMLFGLLDDLQRCEPMQERVQALRDRILRGLNWYELVPLLDDLAQLMIAVANHGQREFENYLQVLNERLASMQESLGTTHAGHDEGRTAAQALDAELRSQVGGLQDSMLQASDLASLKATVQIRLDGLLSTVDAYEQQRVERERQMSERLTALAERVVSLEEAASGMRRHIREQRRQAMRDPLTGLPNRAAWDERVALEVARQQRYGGQLLLAVLDVDHFKRINDSFGHLAGDRVLKIIANELRKRLRKTDFIARFGGEEFALLLPETSLEAGQLLMEELRNGIQNCPFHFKGERIEVTLSGGLAAFAEAERVEWAFERADRALYRAKNAGRNRIEMADPA